MEPGNRVLHRRLGVLGTGTVIDVTSDGEVQVAFGIRRVWAKDHELELHYWRPGTLVFCPGLNRTGVVRDSRSVGGIRVYDVFVDDQTRSFPEDNLEEAVKPPPVARLLTHPVKDWDSPRDLDLKLMATRMQFAYAHDTGSCLSAARLEPMAHQVFVTHRVTQQPFPRYILADEPGLGKTVEAGMIIKELRARGLIRRVLIVAPAGLVTQWKWELANKFNERFEIYDSQMVKWVRQRIPVGANPWEADDGIVVSLALARQDELALEIADANWDLVIVDEAHHLRRHLERGNKIRNTQAYFLGAHLASRAEGLLLLTATPLQLHSFELFSVVNLVDPSLFPSYEVFKTYEATIPELNQALRLLDDTAEWEAKRPTLGRLLDHLGERAPTDTNPTALDELRERLSRRHLLAHIMIRNRKREIGGFTERVAKTISVTLSPMEQQVYNEIYDYVRTAYQYATQQDNWALRLTMIVFQRLLASSSYAMKCAIGRRISALKKAESVTQPTNASAPEDTDDSDVVADSVLQVTPMAGELAELERFALRVSQIGVDTKVRRLEEMLDEMLRKAEEKALIFTQFRDTAKYLTDYLSQRYRVVCFHGGLNRQEKDVVAAQFRDSAQIMVSTEAGGEGRNFQFCHFLFNYDLPWNPMRVEQRIGRLDRIGQKKKVFVYNFTISGTVEESVFGALTDRIKLFERNIGVLDPILGELEDDIRRIILEHGRDYHLEVKILERRLEDRIQEALAVEEKLGDFMMDLRDFRQDRALALLGRTPPFKEQDLLDFVQTVLQRHDAKAITSAGAGMYYINIPLGLRHELPNLEPTYRGTFDVALARDKEELDFFAFGHPLVDELVDYVRSERFPGTAGMRVVHCSDHAGFMGIQWNMVVEFSGVEPYRLTLPVLVGLDGSCDRARAEKIAAAPVRSTVDQSFDDLNPDLLVGLSERAMEEAFIQARVHQQERQRENDHRYHAYRDKLEAFRQAKLALLHQRREASQTQLAEKEASLEAGHRKILPLLKARLTKTEREIAEVGAQFDRRISDLEQCTHVTFSVKVLSVVPTRVE